MDTSGPTAQTVWPPIPVRLTLVAVGAVIFWLAVGQRSMAQERALMTSGKTAAGRATGSRESMRREGSYKSTFFYEFTAEDGNTYSGKSSGYKSTGRTGRVTYLPTNPSVNRWGVKSKAEWQVEIARARNLSLGGLAIYLMFALRIALPARRR